LFDIFFTNGSYNVIIENIYTFTSYQDCVDPGLEILLKLLKLKKKGTQDLISELNKSHMFYESARKILKVHDCNMKIMTKILSIIFYLKSEKFFNLISITKLKNIFTIYKNVNFDLIHEVIIFLLKTLIANRINTYHKLNPIKTLSRNNSMSIRSVNSKNADKKNEEVNNISKNSNSNASLNNSNSSLNNSNSKIKKISIEYRNSMNNNTNKSLSPLKNNKTLSKNKSTGSIKSNSLNNVNLNTDSSVVNRNNNLNNEENNKSNRESPNVSMNNDNTNKNNSESEAILDYGNFFPSDRAIADINGGMFTIEELNDILNIFNPALTMIKAKIYQLDVQRNNKIFYKFVSCVEVISFMILTVITCKDNTEKLKYLIYFRIVEALVSIVSINSSKGIYRDIKYHFANRQYIMINNKILIIKKFYYIFKIIEILRDRFPNLRVKEYYF